MLAIRHSDRRRFSRRDKADLRRLADDPVGPFAYVEIIGPGAAAKRVECNSYTARGAVDDLGDRLNHRVEFSAKRGAFTVWSARKHPG
jgi:hypothetical protein